MRIKVKVHSDFTSPAVRDTMYKKGFRFGCEGNYRETEKRDKDGFPYVECDYFFFDNEEEAKNFANAQYYPISGMPAKVEEIPEHTETWEERNARWEKEKAEEKAKRDAKEAKKALEKGMSLEEYKKEKAKNAKIRHLEKEIEKLEKDLDEKRATLAKLR